MLDITPDPSSWPKIAPLLVRFLYFSYGFNVMIDSSVPKPWTRHCPHNASRLLRSIAKSSETSCYKLRRISPQDGPVGSTKDLLARQRITSNVQAATLDFAAITLTVIERFSRNSAGQVLSGRGTSSRNEKSNKQGACQMRPMQALVNTASRQENQKD